MQFPSWFEGHFDDIEATVIAILNKHCADVSPKPTVKGWFQEGWRDLLPLINVVRVPTIASDDRLIDRTLVHLFVVCETRADSWALSDFVTAVFSAYDRGGIVQVGDRRVDVRSISRVQGPELQVEDSEFAERVIPMSFEVATRKSVKRPDYREVLDP